MPEREYRARSERSQSDYKNFLEPTPAHAKHAMDQAHESTDSMLIGTCVHGLVLEGRRVFDVVAGCKTQKNPAQIPGGKILLSTHSAAIVEGMAAGIRRNRGAMLLLESCADRELSIFWGGKKARLDGSCPLGVVDLKSTKGADIWAFSKSIHEYGYHVQAAHYLEAAAVAGLPADDFYIVAAENFEPFECAVYRISHEALEIGRRELDRLIALHDECAASGVYPGYSEEPVEISLPPWAMK
jgi:exodeoxyribonuclease VIII